MSSADNPSRRCPLSRRAVADAALVVVDRQGLAVTSMRAIARELHVEVMSLYRYVTGRDDLLDAVVDRIVDELDDDPDVERAPSAGWQLYLAGLARGVRRSALRHPHAFPLVATRPSQAPWINPPLRSLRWIERMLAALEASKFTDEQIQFTYHSFNSFLLGYLLSETGAVALADPRAGDSALSAPTASAAGAPNPGGASRQAGEQFDSADDAAAVPGTLSPSRTLRDRRVVAAKAPAELTDPSHDVDRRFPVIARLRAGLAEDRWEREFEVGLLQLVDRIEVFRAGRG